MAEELRIGLIAHDARKSDLVEFVGRHIAFFRGVSLVATGTTGARIAEAHEGLDVVRLKSGPFGGDQQIGAMIAEQKLDVLIFFVDPLTSMPHDVDVKALIRLAAVYDIPLACSRAAAELLVKGLLYERAEATAAGQLS
jgi:methylglyoxal synthase